MRKSPYMQVKEKALPYIHDYCDDLLKRDRASLTKFKTVPFLHFTGKSGTMLCFLSPADTYPAAGKLVPYLFSVADREHILQQKVELVYHMKSLHRQDLILYGDERQVVRKINQKQAEKIIKNYQERILKEWEPKKISH